MFFLPYKDDNPTRTFPLVNWVIIIANFCVFFALQFPLDGKQQMAYFSNQVAMFDLERTNCVYGKTCPTIAACIRANKNVRPHTVDKILWLINFVGEVAHFQMIRYQ